MKMIDCFDTASLELSKARAVLACAIDRYDQGEEDEATSLLVETVFEKLCETEEFFRHCVVTCERCPKCKETY